MAGRYDNNPFDEEEDINPFAKPGVAPVSSGRLFPLPPEPVDYDRSPTVDIPLDSSQDLKKRKKELEAKEAELKKKEEELRRREEAIKRSGVVIEEKNWPPFFPLIHNDIENEIPIHLQRLLYVAFTTYLGLIVCLVWNIVAVTGAWIRGEGVKIWLLSIIYLMAGAPGAYICWYRPLYRAMRYDSALKFGWFFIVYAFHIGFCIIAALGPPFIFEGKSLTGLFAALDVLTNYGFVGILYLIGFGLFCLETLLSIWVIQQIYMYFRGSGMAAEMRKEATRQTMMNAL